MTMTNENNLNIIGDNQRKSRFDPNLAEQVNREVEEQERKKALEEKLGRGKKQDEMPAPMVNLTINPLEYIQVPQHNVLISKNEILGKVNWDNAHLELNALGLFMPTIPIFMTHYLNTRDVLEGKKSLYYGNGKKLSHIEVEEHWNKISNDCWTWLDAFFNLENGIWKMTDKINGKVDLADCLQEDCFADLDSDSLNEQGLPTSKSPIQTPYRLSKIYFHSPRDDCLAWFSAGSDGTILYCGTSRLSAGPNLRVFGCYKNVQGGDKK